MKYAQLLIGLLAGTALGSTVIAGSLGGSSSGLTEDAVKKIVRETISAEPKLIMDSVQKFQESQREESLKSASDALKDKSLKEAVYNAKDTASTGPADSAKVIVEFFDYNCHVCRDQYKVIAQVLAQDKSIRVLFREFPIFGASSETNSKIGLAVSRIAPEKYLAFHEKMMTHEGRTGEKEALEFVKAVGIDVEKVKAEMKNPAIDDILKANRELGDKLHIQGTPTFVIGEEMIPHGLGADEIVQKLGAPAAPAADKK